MIMRGKGLRNHRFHLGGRASMRPRMIMRGKASAGQLPPYHAPCFNEAAHDHARKACRPRDTPAGG